jgi:hypothetical protein
MPSTKVLQLGADGLRNEVTVSPDDNINRYVQVGFSAAANVKNKWLDMDGPAISSDNTAFLNPFDIDFFGWTFSNSINNSRTDIEIYKNGITAPDLITTIPIRSSRVAWDSTIVPISFLAGDTIHVFAADAGNPIPKNVTFIMHFRNPNNTPRSGTKVTI